MNNNYSVAKTNTFMGSFYKGWIYIIGYMFLFAFLIGDRGDGGVSIIVLSVIFTVISCAMYFLKNKNNIKHHNSSITASAKQLGLDSSGVEIHSIPQDFQNMSVLGLTTNGI